MHVALPAYDTVQWVPGSYGDLVDLESLGAVTQPPTEGSPVNGPVSCLFGKVEVEHVTDDGKLQKDYTIQIVISGKLFVGDVYDKWTDKEVTICAYPSVRIAV
jgi:hypothetical protein